MSLSAFLPSIALDYLQRHPDRSIGAPERLRGTCLFADVSGFTVLSESLAGLGREGAEILTRVLNSFYAEVIAILGPAGGDVVRFAGDAVTVFFPGAGRGSNAVAAACALQAMMEKFTAVKTPAGEFPLRMKIGMASGECVFFLVGDAEGLDYAFAGKPVDLAAEAEHHASAGDIVWADAGGRRKAEGERWEPAGDGMYHILNQSSSPTSTLHPSSFILPPSPAAADALTEPFLHPRILELYKTGSLGLANEHRQAAVLFVQTGQTLDYALPEDLAALAAFYAEAQALCRRYDGHINKIDCGDKGNKLLVVFGAPVAHEDDADRALEFALALQARSKETGLSLRIGINRARVFCGLVGSQARHEYTVMGDGVNVAARLMQAAHDHACLASQTLKESASSSYFFQDLPPMQFKGKSRPMPVVKLQGRTGEKFQVPYFIGREEEQQSLLKALESHPETQAFLAWVEGEPGIGKSYFLQHFAQRHLPPEGLHQSRCQSYAASLAYYPFQKFLLEILQGLSTAGAAGPREKILAVLGQKDPEVVDYAPLLFRVLHLAAADEPEPGLEPEIRRSVLWKMMLLLVEEAVRRREIVWVIDNAQWMDGESRAFLVHILRMLDSGRLRIFAASREPAPEEPGIRVCAVGLKPFTETESRAFACASLGVKEVPEEALGKARAVGKGNPLLELESFKLMLRSGYLSRSEDFPDLLMVDAALSEEMPESLAGIVLSQMDALPAAEKAALSRLAAAGVNIPEALAGALGVEAAALGRLASSGQFLRFNPSSRNYFFAKQTYQQAVYESLEFSFRRETHLAVAQAAERLFDPSLPDLPHLLAHHFGEAGSPRALPFLEKIGREAKNAYALQEAVHAYRRIVEIGSEAGADIQEALVGLAELHLLLGKADEAIKLLEGHFARFAADRLSPAHRILAGAFRARGAFPQAEMHAKKALENAKNSHDAFMAECFLGKLYGQTGRFGQALKTMERIEADHKAFNNDPEFQMNRMHLAFVRYQTGHASQAVPTFQRLRKWFARHHQVKGLYTILNNLSMLDLEAGHYADSLGLFLKAYHLLKTYGVWESETILKLLFNLGLCSLHRGDFSAAERYWSQAMAYAARFDSPLRYKAHSLLADAALQQGDYAASLKHLHQALDLCAKLGLPRDEVLEICMDLYGELNHAGRYRKALADYQAEIRAQGLTFLLPSLMNYEAEGALMTGDAEAYRERQTSNLAACLNQADLPQAYRAARFLFGLGRTEKHLGQMGEILERLKRRQFQVEWAYLNYTVQPDGKARSALVRLLNRYPYGLLKAQSYAAFTVRTGRKDLKTRFTAKTAEWIRRMGEGLEPELQDSFFARPEFRAIPVKG